MGLQEHISNAQSGKLHGIQEGYDIERAVFGAPVIPPRERKSGYVPFQESVTFVKEHQPDPLKRSPFVKRLRSMVVEDCADTTVPVKFFTAVGTPLDRYHGVDAFFEQGGFWLRSIFRPEKRKCTKLTFF